MEQGDENPATRATESVAESNGATAGVHILNTETKDLCVGLNNGGKGLVELPNSDVGLGKAGLLENFLNNSGRCNGEVNGV